MVDVADSKSADGDIVWVRVPPPAPNQYNPNQIFLVGDGFGLFVFFEKFEKTHFNPESIGQGKRKNNQKGKVMKKTIKSCKYNIDSGCVELKFLDGSMLSIDCTAVENEAADNRFQRLNGDVGLYLKTVTEYKSIS